MKDVLYATGHFEIGDTFLDEYGKRHTITDVRVVHYIREGTYKVSYEIDRSGKFEELELVPASEMPQLNGRGKSTIKTIQFKVVK